MMKTFSHFNQEGNGDGSEAFPFWNCHEAGKRVQALCACGGSKLPLDLNWFKNLLISYTCLEVWVDPNESQYQFSKHMEGNVI